MVRTHDREWKRAAAPVMFIGRGMMTQGEKALYRQRKPFSVIEVSRPSELKQQMQESTTVPYNPAITQSSISLAERDIQLMAGIPNSAGGTPDSGQTATENAIAANGMNRGFNRRRWQTNQTLEPMLRHMLELSLKVYPESVMRDKYGQNAKWPVLSAEQLATTLSISVRSGIDRDDATQKEVQAIQTIQQIATATQTPINGMALIEDALVAMGKSRNLGRYMLPPPPPMGMPNGPQGMPPQGQPQQGPPQGPPQGQPPQNPNQQGPHGAQGGRPVMQQAPMPHQIPNRPQM